MFPPLLSPVREIACDAGRDPKDVVAGGRRHHIRVGTDALPAAQHGMHLVTGRMRHGVPVLRDGAGRADPQPVDRRDRRAGARCGGALARTAGRLGRAQRRGENRLSNVVFMGMGEPLANYNRVLARCGGSSTPPPNGFGISARSVTVSTVGLAPAIRKLADERPGRDAGAVAARPRRRTTRHARAGEQPLEGRRGAGRRPVLTPT